MVVTYFLLFVKFLGVHVSTELLIIDAPLVVATRKRDRIFKEELHEKCVMGLSQIKFKYSSIF